MKNQQPPLPRPWHQMALSGVATAAALGLLGLSASATAAPTTPGSAPLALASSAQTSAASVGVPRALPAASTTLTEHVTDELGILDASKAQQAVDTMSSKYGVGLWVLTVSDSSQKASAIAAQTFKDTKLGRDDMLLVINIPSDGSASKSYKLQAHSNSSKFSESDYKRIDSAIKKQLSAGNYDDAVAAIPDNMSGSSGSGSSGDSGSSALPLLLGGGAVAAGGAAAWTVYKRRKNKENDDMLFGKRKKQAASGGTPAAQASGPAAMTVEQLRTQAGSALVQADDTVRAAAEELSYAQAQFGLSATDAFTAALDSARKHLSRCFELRKILDDDIPETEPQQRQMYTEILQHCSEAVGEIRAQEEAFNKRRGIEANLPTSIAETAQRADETEQAIVMAETILVTLSAAYPASSLTSVAQAPEQARRLLAAGRTALDQARASVEASQEATAVEQVRIAQGSIAQAGQLAAQVTGARERLQSAAKDLEAAIASISSDLVDAKRLEGAVPAATLAPLVADAEAAVAEGHQASGANPSGDPLAALDHLARAEAAIDAALAPAREREENDSRARASLGSRLARLNSQVESVTSYITTYRGAVGPSARTALSEAARHATAATTVQTTDPVAALAEVAAAEPLVAQAQALAEADVRGSSSSWSPRSGESYSYSRDYGRSGGGLDLGSLLLGGLLLGGGHNYGGWSSHHHDNDRGGGFFSGGGDFLDGVGDFFDGVGDFFDGGGDF
ncbi:TPM domain-containing protein [Actinomyces sp. oral taxon 169]|uniref:TPM domain-containing protein n=1 Tax=Actinomyces sp. oral taxon 169 TaxID=712116 RepID=UPI0015FEB6C6|nr:TPM domain-containing protein [Actinomyces sp. oral taxon 169]QLF54341.1 TPM domain-containing protein [Actinomyces sp. oral taxon 169]